MESRQKTSGNVTNEVILFWESVLQPMCQTLKGERRWTENQTSPKTTMWIIEKSTLALTEAAHVASTLASKSAHLEG